MYLFFSTQNVKLEGDMNCTPAPLTASDIIHFWDEIHSKLCNFKHDSKALCEKISRFPLIDFKTKFYDKSNINLLANITTLGRIIFSVEPPTYFSHLTNSGSNNKGNSSYTVETPKDTFGPKNCCVYLGSVLITEVKLKGND
jgi:hypothetical protein